MVHEATPRISVVIPMLDEAPNVAPLLQRLTAVLEHVGEEYEILAVDDGSRDGTWEALKSAREQCCQLRALRLARNVGQHAAVLVGFGAARGAWIITIDADLQNPPEEIPRLVAAFRAGHDLVGTFRQDRQDPAFRKLASRLVNSIFRGLRRTQIRDFGCMLRGYSAAVATAVACHEGRWTFIPALAAIHATNPVEIPVRHAERATGKSKYSLWRLCGLAGAALIAFGPRRVYTGRRSRASTRQARHVVAEELGRGSLVTESKEGKEPWLTGAASS